MGAVAVRAFLPGGLLVGVGHPAEHRITQRAGGAQRYEPPVVIFGVPEQREDGELTHLVEGLGVGVPDLLLRPQLALVQPGGGLTERELRLGGCNRERDRHTTQLSSSMLYDILAGIVAPVTTRSTVVTDG